MRVKWQKSAPDWKLDFDKQAFIDQDPAVIAHVARLLSEKISELHHTILDDWAKVCMSEIYQKEGKIFPCDYELVEQQDRDDPFATRYYYRKRDIEADERDREIIRLEKETEIARLKQELKEINEKV